MVECMGRYPSPLKRMRVGYTLENIGPITCPAAPGFEAGGLQDHFQERGGFPARPRPLFRANNSMRACSYVGEYSGCDGNYGSINPCR